MTNSALQQLRSLDADVRAQIEYAVTLLTPRTRRDVLMAALDLLAETSTPAARTPLLDLYAHFADQQGKRDPGAYVRSAVLQALRTTVEPGDLELLITAVTTYEYSPPDFTDDACLLRAAGLIALSGVDDELGRYHAVRLLADAENTERMSGEPAVTAAQVLGAQHEMTTLFFYAMRPVHSDYGEVMAEALRQLTALPPAMIPGLFERHGESEDAITLLGLFDLLLTHEDGPQGIDYISDFLAATRHYDVYRYLVTAMIASGNQTLLNTLLASARHERDKEKITILIRALALMAGNEAVDEMVELIG